MSIEKILKENKVWITGELTEYDLTIRQDNENREYISGQVVIKSIINGEEQLTPVDLYSRAITAAGAPNKLYASYVALENKIGKRVTIQGEIQENRYFQENSGQVVSYNRIAGRFINDARANQEDRVDFAFAGYIVSPVSERLNQKGDVLFHEITIAEANYNGEFPIYVKFIVTSPKIVSAIQQLYQKGDTVKVYGKYLVSSSSEEVVEEVTFGEPISRVYTSTFRNLVIESGTEPIENGAYSPETIAELDNAYAERGVDIESKGRNVTVSADTPTVKKGLGKSLL